MNLRENFDFEMFVGNPHPFTAFNCRYSSSYSARVSGLGRNFLLSKRSNDLATLPGNVLQLSCEY